MQLARGSGVTTGIVVNGAGGRMGRRVAAALVRADLGAVQGCDTTPGELRLDDGSLLQRAASLDAAPEPGGVIVDFSHPSATASLARAARERGVRLVIGTTGQSAADLELLRGAAACVPVVVARNFSLGLNRILELCSGFRVLLDDGFDLECLEAHHRDKRDAPSGTALALLDAVTGGDRGALVHGRQGPEARRRVGDIGVHSMRLGGVAGDHALVFGGDHEVVEIRHRALDRDAFVTGVVPAVRFVQGKSPGFYSMQDVLRDAVRTAV